MGNKSNGADPAVKYLFLFFLFFLLMGSSRGRVEASVWLSPPSPSSSSRSSPCCSYLCASSFLSGLSTGRPILHKKKQTDVTNIMRRAVFSLIHTLCFLMGRRAEAALAMKFNQTEQSTCCKCARGVMFPFPFLSSGECSVCQHAVAHWRSRVIVAGRIQMMLQR